MLRQPYLHDSILILVLVHTFCYLDTLWLAVWEVYSGFKYDQEYLDNSQEVITNIPCCASSIIYSPPSIVWIKSIVGEMRSALLLRSGSSVFRKCHTSDDELEELDSPLASIITDKFPPKFETKEHGTSSAIRYQLLREVWRDDD